MRHFALLLLSAASVLLVLSSALPANASDALPFQRGFNVWRAAGGDFSTWALTGVDQHADGKLVLNPATAKPGNDPYPAGGYNGGTYYNGGAFLVGEASGPVIATFNFAEAIASWDADTPEGSWVEVQMRAQRGTTFTKWYSMGVWASEEGTVKRHSVTSQGDADGYVATDTLVMAKSKIAVTGYQVKVRLFSADGSVVPVVRNISVTYSTAAQKKVVSKTGTIISREEKILAVPECSQMVYPDGGNVWCSPTSTSMVLGYWGIDPGLCEPRVRAAVAGVYDWVYDGHGNWPFNTAYAASRGLEAYVVRYDSLAQLEPWIDDGIPVVMSIAWGKGDLTGAPIPASSGHLVVLVGFTAAGDPIVNDPAAGTNEDVQRTYLRGELESVWQTNSAGTVYLIYPPDHVTPGFNQ